MKKLVFVLVISASLIACKDSDSELNRKEFKEFLKKTEAFSPAPTNISNVINMMIMSGAKYNPEITNATDLVEKYKNDVLYAASNCGSYTADALYHFAFNNREQAFESYTAAQDLANHLGFGALYAGRYFNRISENMESTRDSVLFEFDDVLKQVDSSLTQHARHQIKLAYLLGNSIEKLYLIDQALQSVEANMEGKISLEANKLLHAYLNQEFALKNLVELVDKYKKHEDSPFFKELFTLYALYYNLEDRLEPEYVDYEEFKRSPEIMAISDQIQIVRNQLVN